MYIKHLKHPLRNTIEHFLSSAKECTDNDMIPVNKEFYLDIAERIVRYAAEYWQNGDGLIIDEYDIRDYRLISTATPRYIGAVASLVKAGRCIDLVETVAKAMDTLCETVPGGKEPSSDFYMKEMLLGYINLFPYIEPVRSKRWFEKIKMINPVKVYRAGTIESIPVQKNWNMYVVAGEFMRMVKGAAYELLSTKEFIDDSIEEQKKYFNEFGMYMDDPEGPMTYDLTVRQNLSFLIDQGYLGKHREYIDDVLQKGGLTMLFMQSRNGQAPFGGRSNQFHIMEAMFCYNAEHQANFHKKTGDYRLAGIFKRSAKLAAYSINKWFEDNNVWYHTKNRFAPSLYHGCEDSGGTSVYGLLFANLFASSYHISDDTIREELCPADSGTYAVEIQKEFHKVFAAAGDYSIEIDTRGQEGRDATGLGRLHHRLFPVTAALSSTITENCCYRNIFGTRQKRYSMGVEWLTDNGIPKRLAEYRDSIKEAKLENFNINGSSIKFDVSYYIADSDEEITVMEEYTINTDGIIVKTWLNKPTRLIRYNIPFLITDGYEASHLKIDKKSIAILFEDSIFSAESLEPVCPPHVMEKLETANRNGVYKIGYFETDIPTIKVSLKIYPK